MKRRVVVTGLGAVTPIGNTVEEFWSGIKEGKVGIGEITKFDTTEYKVKIAAEVKDFQAKDRMDFKAARRMEPFSQYAVAAAKEAFEDAGLDMSKEDPFRVGVIVGSGIGSLQSVEREYKKLLEKGPNRVNPLLVPLMISNMAAGNVSIQFGLKGKNIKGPDDFDYDAVDSLRIEARQKLKLYRPVSIGQASRISGVSPADITMLLVYMEQVKK